MLGHEGNGSLLAILRDAGWADGLSAGVTRGDGQHALFQVDISLTPEGSRHIQRIQASLFAAIRAIRDNGVEAWRYDEQARLAEQAFRFQQHGSALDDAMRLSMNLSRYPVEDVNYAPYRMDGFDASGIDTWLSALRPDNMLRLYSGPEVEGERTSPWFDTPWTPVALEDDSAQPLAGLSLPEPNPYIAEDLELFDGQQDEQPRKRLDEPGFEFWHMRDASFDTPKVEWRFSLQHPDASHDARKAALSRLLAGWLQDSLNEALYPHAWPDTASKLCTRPGHHAVVFRLAGSPGPADRARAGTIARRQDRARQRRTGSRTPASRLAQRASGRPLPTGRPHPDRSLIRPQWSPEALLAASEDLDARHCATSARPSSTSCISRPWLSATWTPSRQNSRRAASPRTCDHSSPTTRFPNWRPCAPASRFPH